MQIVNVVIRTCQAADLVMLREEFRSGPSWLHEERFVEQQRGESAYLITWADERPVAHLKVRWAGSVHDHVAGRLPGVPEIRRFSVIPELRGHGIGTRLLAKAESMIIDRGFAKVGLAVGVDNDGARRLYDRAGYSDWGRGHFESRWSLLDNDTVVGEYVHTATYMFKTLAQPNLGDPQVEHAVA